ncbi:MAG: UvrD-helicase domain-containing protein, partial [Oscillospiraceae bacterium]|nr:UvrD-helicase domain-containing protein [Oscillospiraceae bacterium]
MGKLNASGPKWTPAQHRAIYDQSGTLLVSAAAGSGKTAVLVNRALELICREDDPIPAEQLLIVTFTNAAAAELRGRLAKGLAKQVQAAAGKGAGRQNFLRRQQMMLGRAAIGTIDSFCLDMLKQNFRSLDIPPDFSAAEENTLFALRQQALEEVLAQSYANPDFCAFADLYGKSRSDAQAGETILRVYGFLRSLPEYRRWLRKSLAAWQQPGPVENTPWADRLLEDAAAICEAAVLFEEGILELCGFAERENLLLLSNAYSPFFLVEKQSLQEMQTLAEGKEYRKLAACLAGFSWKTLPRVNTKPKKNATQEEIWACGRMERYKDQIKPLRDRAKKLVEETEELLPTQEVFEEDCRVSAPMLTALVEAIEAFDERYFELKCEKKVLEFSDFEHLTLQLLWDGEKEERTPLAAQLSRNYRVVMVDEYQDTNRLQDLLYHCLAGEKQDNLFFVGDMKQGIYSFRQADPEIFLEKKDSYALIEEPETWQPGQSYPAAIALDKNFRSARGVIHAINGICDAVMTRRLGGVDYAADPGERLSLPEGASPYPGSCEMHLVGSPEGADAHAVAARIRQMLESGFLVREGETTRPCRPEDFCILLRARKKFDEYAQALEAQGLEACADVNEDLLQSPAVRPLVNLLRVLDNPAQDIPLAAVLLGPLGGLTVGEVTRLRALHPGGSLYTALLPAWQKGQATPAEKDLNKENGEWYRSLPAGPAEEKAAAFYKKLALLRRLARTLPVDRLLDEIYARTGYPALVGAMAGGSARREELARFTEFAAAAGAGGLAALVRALDSMEEAGQRIPLAAGAASAQPGKVSIMTIHRSKGLEFPVVILADTTHNFNVSDQRDPVMLHRQLGLGLKLRGQGGLYPTMAQTAIQRSKKAEALSEEMRVLYVALTRAKDALLLFVPYKEMEKAGLQEFLERQGRAIQCGAGRVQAAYAQNTAAWLLLAALQNKNGALLWEQTAFEAPPAKSEWPLQLFFEDNDPPAEPAEEKAFMAPADEALARDLEEGMGWEYPHKARTAVAAKVSVTSVVHREERETLMARPAFLLKDGMTGAEKGTALHAFMEHADFALAKQDLKAEARRQKDERLLEEELFDKLDYESLERFFAGSLFARMEQAKELLREYDFISAIPAAELAGTEARELVLERDGDMV